MPNEFGFDRLNDLFGGFASALTIVKDDHALATKTFVRGYGRDHVQDPLVRQALDGLVAGMFERHPAPTHADIGRELEKTILAIAFMRRRRRPEASAKTAKLTGNKTA